MVDKFFCRINPVKDIANSSGSEYISVYENSIIDKYIRISLHSFNYKHNNHIKLDIETAEQFVEELLSIIEKMKKGGKNG